MTENEKLSLDGDLELFFPKTPSIEEIDSMMEEINISENDMAKCESAGDIVDKIDSVSIKYNEYYKDVSDTLYELTVRRRRDIIKFSSRLKEIIESKQKELEELKKVHDRKLFQVITKHKCPNNIVILNVNSICEDMDERLSELLLEYREQFGDIGVDPSNFKGSSQVLIDDGGEEVILFDEEDIDGEFQDAIADTELPHAEYEDTKFLEKGDIDNYNEWSND